MDELNRRQEAFLLALLQSGNVDRAAEDAGIANKTAYRYLKEPAFSKAYKDTRQQILQSAITKLTGNLTAAIDTLAEVMTDQANPPTSRVSAARAVLESTFKALEMDSMDDLANRIEELERDIAALTGEEAILTETQKRRGHHG